MLNLSSNSHGSANIVPARKLANRQNVSVTQWDVVLFISAHGRRKVDLQAIARICSRGIRVKARKIRAIRIGASLQTAGYMDQIFDMHVGSERIPAGLGDLAVDVDRRRIDTRGVTVNQQAVPRLNQDVVRRIAS